MQGGEEGSRSRQRERLQISRTREKLEIHFVTVHERKLTNVSIDEIKSVEKAREDKMLAHEEIRHIIIAVGAGLDNGGEENGGWSGS